MMDLYWLQVDIWFMARKLNVTNVHPSRQFILSRVWSPRLANLRTKVQWRIICPVQLLQVSLLPLCTCNTDDVACCDILELEIPHEDHIKCIIWIRLVLDPDQPIEDYDDVSLFVMLSDFEWDYKGSRVVAIRYWSLSREWLCVTSYWQELKRRMTTSNDFNARPDWRTLCSGVCDGFCHLGRVYWMKVWCV